MSGGDGWFERAYLREILQRLASINELLFALVAANLLSSPSEIRGHLLDDSDALRLDLLEVLCQLETNIGLPSSAHGEQRTAEILWTLTTDEGLKRVVSTFKRIWASWVKATI